MSVISSNNADILVNVSVILFLPIGPGTAALMSPRHAASASDVKTVLPVHPDICKDRGNKRIYHMCDESRWMTWISSFNSVTVLLPTDKEK